MIMGIQNTITLSEERSKERQERALERYSQVLRNKTVQLVGRGKAEGYRSSYFYKLKSGWGGLFFEKPGIFWKFFGMRFPKYRLERSMAYAQKIHPHFLACTELLEQARAAGELHPIFAPVKIGKKNFRPFRAKCAKFQASGLVPSITVQPRVMKRSSQRQLPTQLRWGRTEFRTSAWLKMAPGP